MAASNVLPEDSLHRKGWPWENTISPVATSGSELSISVVIPSYNQGKFIEEAIRSVLLQNYPSVELIVIDGGSTDETVEVLKKYNSWITYWVSEKDSGQSEAINKGFAKATGDIINWLCSDDLLMPGALHEIAESFRKHPEAGLTYGKTMLVDAGLKELSVDHSSFIPNVERYLSHISFSQPSAFFKRALLAQTGFLNKDLHFSMDYDLYCRLALITSFVKEDSTWTQYRLHEESKSVMYESRFTRDYINAFANLLHNLGYKNSIKLIRDRGLEIDESVFYTYAFTPRVKVDEHKLMLFFLCGLISQLYSRRQLDLWNMLMSYVTQKYSVKELEPESDMKTMLKWYKIPFPLLKLMLKVKDKI